ncbi:hypothetical protein SLS63_011533 [Diaporthe eres]|uniref:FAD-binding PCMH-type domain-containing protein n=1 Tax=Diaporthe eres TaxID=83184 RepID=A0ABR1NTR4_DIAER
MRSTLLPLSLTISSTVLGQWHHPKRAPELDHDSGKACEEIKSQISSASEVIDGVVELGLTDDTHHWFFESSSETPTCVVEVGSPADVSVAMTAIGNHGAPFALYSAGHASNKGFSSTTGVHIAMKRMNQVVLSADKSTVEIGTGNGWADVYGKLDGTGVNVVGGRVKGPGVDENPDLFFALKGGLNRFAVVTSAVYKTHPQTDEVYAGATIYTSDQVDAVLNATQVFSDVNTDPKAQIITTINATPVGLAALVLFFYDGPDAGTAFEMFDGVDHTISLVRAQSFSTFVSTVDSSISLNPRGTFNTLPTTKTTPAFLAAVKNQASLNLYFSWTFESDDQFWNDAMVNAISELREVAKQEGIFDESSAVYPNYAISGTTAEQLYGSANAARLRTIKASVDPNNVMNLAGGFDI